jgi:hypothetical protein
MLNEKHQTTLNKLIQIHENSLKEKANRLPQTWVVSDLARILKLVHKDLTACNAKELEKNIIDCMY